ncbi:GDSL-type esterase/lipase family protein [Xanthobacter versatilis]|uniref:GDSL-type esterase/lipase family protein n=1 Tax=Xanthobacter autotrophicus (strain ATCC BAA-1158 / Py2) TaxID=78245 RepID=UPI003728A3D6
MSVDSIARGMAAAPWTRMRNPNLLCTYGDSLAASLTVDTSLKQNLGANAPINWVNVRGGGNLRFVTLNNGNFGVSGQRSDQILARLPDVMASGAGTVIIYAGTNDIAQNYPTAGTAAATAAANIMLMARAIIASGAQVVIELPVGSTSWTAAQIGANYELHQRLREFSEGTPNVYLHDATPTVMDTSSSSTTALVAQANRLYDATHPNGLGAYYWSKSLGALMDKITRPYPRMSHMLASDAQASAYVTNGLFLTQTGGTNSIGAALTSGAVPGSWTLLRSGSPTVGITYGTDDGTATDPSIGAKVILTIAFTAANEYVRLYQDLAPPRLNIGDVLELGARHRVTSGMATLTSSRLHAPVQVDGVTRDWYSMLEGAAAQYGPDEAYQADHRIGPLTVWPGTTMNYLSFRHQVTARAAGTVVVEISRSGIRKRIAA